MYHILDRLVLVAAILAWAFFPASPASAQWGALPTSGAISTSGSAELKVAPDTLRMHVILMGHGSDMEKALADLATKQAEAMKKLAALGVDEKRIEVEQPEVSSLISDRQRQLQMMQRQMGRARGVAAAKSPSAELVAVSCLLQAEWPIKEAFPDKRLAWCHDLCSRIKQAQIAGASAAGQLTPEEQEQLEELQIMQGDEDEETPGTPQFYYLGTISEQQRLKAVTQAFKQARERAAALAMAAGAELGELNSLTSISSSSGFDFDDDYSPYGNRYSGQSVKALKNVISDTRVVGAQCGPLTQDIDVAVSFKLKQHR